MGGHLSNFPIVRFIILNEQTSLISEVIAVTSIFYLVAIQQMLGPISPYQGIRVIFISPSFISRIWHFFFFFRCFHLYPQTILGSFSLKVPFFDPVAVSAFHII